MWVLYWTPSRHSTWLSFSRHRLAADRPTENPNSPIEAAEQPGRTSGPSRARHISLLSPRSRLPPYVPSGDAFTATGAGEVRYLTAFISGKAGLSVHAASAAANSGLPPASGMALNGGCRLVIQPQ